MIRHNITTKQTRKWLFAMARPLAFALCPFIAISQCEASASQVTLSLDGTVKTDASKPEPARATRTTRYTWDAFNRLSEVRDGANALIAR